MFFRTACARAAEGLRDRGEEPRDRLTTTLFFAVVVRADFLVRVRQRRAGAVKARPPASCGSRSPSPARSRSAARSSASATARRCGRCCWRRRRGPRSTSASCSACWRCSRPTELLLVPMVALLFQAPLFSRPLLLAALLAGGHASGSAPSGRCSPRCWCAPARATCCCRSCCIRSPFR